MQPVLSTSDSTGYVKGE